MDNTQFYYNDNPTTFVCANHFNDATKYQNYLAETVDACQMDCGQHHITGIKKKHDGWLFEHVTQGKSGKIFLADYSAYTQEALFSTLKEKVTQGLDFLYNKLQKLHQVIHKNHTDICHAFQTKYPVCVENGSRALPTDSPPSSPYLDYCKSVWESITNTWKTAYDWVYRNKGNIISLFADITDIKLPDYNFQSVPSFLKFSLKTLIIQGNLSQLIPQQLDQLPNLLILQEHKWTAAQKQALQNLLNRMKDTSLNFATTNGSEVSDLQHFFESVSISWSNPEPLMQGLSRYLAAPQFNKNKLHKFLKDNLSHICNQNWVQIGWYILKETAIMLGELDGLSTSDMTEVDRFLFTICKDLIESCENDLSVIMDAFDFNIDNLPSTLYLIKDYFQPHQIETVNNIVKIMNDLGRSLSTDSGDIEKIKRYMRALNVQWTTKKPIPLS